MTFVVINFYRLLDKFVFTLYVNVKAETIC